MVPDLKKAFKWGGDFETKQTKSKNKSKFNHLLQTKKS